MLAGFRQEGITHVLVHPAGLRVRSRDAPPVGMFERELLLELEPQTREILRALLARHCAHVYGDGQYLIFELSRQGTQR